MEFINKHHRGHVSLRGEGVHLWRVTPLMSEPRSDITPEVSAADLFCFLCRERSTEAFRDVPDGNSNTFIIRSVSHGAALLLLL